MNSLDLINELYKPYKITKLGKSTIIEAMDGKFVVKPKCEGDIKGLFNYLQSRDFDEIPKLIDNSRSDVDIFEYVEEPLYPKDQKALDMAKTVAALHSKTSYNKEVREDKFKEIYENIKENLLYYKDLYQKKVSEIEKKVFMSPSEYLFIRNSSKLFSEIEFTSDKLDSWYDRVKTRRETRVSIVHNNLAMDHFIKGRKSVLISWDKFGVDSPVLDIYNLYRKESLNVEFGSVLKEYFKHMNMTDDEKDLLFILLCMPKDINFLEDEFASCGEISESLDYVFRTEYLVAPYYAPNEVE